MNILGIGESVVDHITVVDTSTTHSPRILDTRHDGGGPVLAAMILLARQRNECTFITSLGDDTQGTTIKRILDQENINLQVQQQKQTKRNDVIVNPLTGERDKIRGNVQQTPIQGIDQELIVAADIIVMDRHERLAFEEIIKHKRPETILITDPSTEVSDFTKKMVSESTVPIVPIEFIAGLQKHADLETSLNVMNSLCNKPFIVTLGDLGSMICDAGTLTLVPAFDVVPVDKTGAGDIYRGGFAQAQAQGLNLLDSANLSNLAAALQCTKHGNGAAVPTSKDLAYHAKLPKKALSIEMVTQLFDEVQSHQDRTKSQAPSTASSRLHSLVLSLI